MPKQEQTMSTTEKLVRKDVEALKQNGDELKAMKDRFDKARLIQACHCSDCKDTILAFILKEQSTLAKEMLGELKNRLQGRIKDWKPTCGYGSEEEKGFQNGIIAEQNLNNQSMIEEIDYIDSLLKERNINI